MLFLTVQQSTGNIKHFDGLTDKEISCLDVQEYEKMDEERMRKNAWKVANEVCDEV